MTSVGNSDFERLIPIRVTNSALIRLFTANDEITLEYDDRVLLSFTPDYSALVPVLEGVGEYIRDTATVHIIDNDGKCVYYEMEPLIPTHTLPFCSVSDHFWRILLSL